MNTVFIGIFGNDKLLSAVPTEDDANEYIKLISSWYDVKDVIFEKRKVVITVPQPSGQIMECL